MRTSHLSLYLFFCFSTFFPLVFSPTSTSHFTLHTFNLHFLARFLSVFVCIFIFSPLFVNSIVSISNISHHVAPINRSPSPAVPATTALPSINRFQSFSIKILISLTCFLPEMAGTLGNCPVFEAKRVCFSTWLSTNTVNFSRAGHEINSTGFVWILLSIMHFDGYA